MGSRGLHDRARLIRPGPVVTAIFVERLHQPWSLAPRIHPPSPLLHLLDPTTPTAHVVRAEGQRRGVLVQGPARAGILGHPPARRECLAGWLTGCSTRCRGWSHL